MTEKLEAHRRESERMTEERREAIRAAHSEGIRISTICEATGLTRTAIYKMLETD